jgi:hypothetical protein
VATAIISDLHLGSVAGVDMAGRPELLERLLPAVAEAEHLVILGDALELRERPVARLLDLARPVFEAIGEAAAGRRVTLVPGNHDHELTDPWLEEARLDDAGLALESVWPVTRDKGIAGRLAGWMPGADVAVAYPGLRLRSDVYATHGHYLDLHLSVPRLEAIAASLMAEVTGRGSVASSPAEYEAVFAPLYALLFGLAQGSKVETVKRHGGMSRRVWESANGRRGSRLTGLLLGRVTIPGAVALMNRAGLGPYRPDISAAELRRAGLRAMGHVVEALGIRADHVIFGHTHRPGPLPGDDASEWRTPRGTRLWNSGSWLNERVFLKSVERKSPYWPGTIVWLEEEGPPRIENLLRDAELPAVAEI